VLAGLIAIGGTLVIQTAVALLPEIEASRSRHSTLNPDSPSHKGNPQRK
jgi:hypothetical protein